MPSTEEAIELAEARTDIRHLAKSYERLSTNVDKLTDAVGESRVAAAAANAITTSALATLQTAVSDLRADVNAKRWPPAAKATVLAAALAGFAGVLGAVL